MGSQRRGPSASADTAQAIDQLAGLEPRARQDLHRGDDLRVLVPAPAAAGLRAARARGAARHLPRLRSPPRDRLDDPARRRLRRHKLQRDGHARPHPASKRWSRRWPTCARRTARNGPTSPGGRSTPRASRIRWPIQRPRATSSPCPRSPRAATPTRCWPARRPPRAGADQTSGASYAFVFDVKDWDNSTGTQRAGPIGATAQPALRRPGAAVG